MGRSRRRAEKAPASESENPTNGDQVQTRRETGPSGTPSQPPTTTKLNPSRGSQAASSITVPLRSRPPADEHTPSSETGGLDDLFSKLHVGPSTTSKSAKGHHQSRPAVIVDKPETRRKFANAPWNQPWRTTEDSTAAPDPPVSLDPAVPPDQSATPNSDTPSQHPTPLYPAHIYHPAAGFNVAKRLDPNAYYPPAHFTPTTPFNPGASTFVPTDQHPYALSTGPTTLQAYAQPYYQPSIAPYGLLTGGQTSLSSGAHLVPRITQPVPARDLSSLRKLKGKQKQKILPRPVPTDGYIRQATADFQWVNQPQKLLLVLDLNGVLVHRKVKTSSFTARPGLDEFLQYALKHHYVAVWSSAGHDNVHKVCEKMFTPEQLSQVLLIWTRANLRLGSHINDNVQVYKQLSWLWDAVNFLHPELGVRFDQTNTVLVDDTREKAASEPHNLIEMDEFDRQPHQMTTDALEQLTGYLEQVKWSDNVSSYMHKSPFVFMPPPYVPPPGEGGVYPS